MTKLALRSVANGKRYMEPAELSLCRKTLGLERFDRVVRTAAGAWVGTRAAPHGDFELRYGARTVAGSTLAVVGAPKEGVSAHPTLERVLVCTSDMWATRILEIDLESRRVTVLGWHDDAVMAAYVGADHLAVVSPIGVTLMRRDPDRLVFSGHAPVGGLAVYSVHSGAQLLIESSRGWAVVQVEPMRLVAISGRAKGGEGALVFERGGQVFADVDEGKLFEVTLPERKAKPISVDRWKLQQAADAKARFGLVPASGIPPRPPTPVVKGKGKKLTVAGTPLKLDEPAAPEELRFDLATPMLVAAPVAEVFEVSGKKTRRDPTGHVGVLAIARLEAKRYAYVTNELRVRTFGKGEVARPGSGCLDVAVVPGSKLLLTLGYLEGDVHPSVKGASMTRLNVVSPDGPFDEHTFWLPGAGYRLEPRDDRMFVVGDAGSFELVGIDALIARYQKKGR